MKNKKFTRTLLTVLSCLLLVGVAFGIVAVADSTDADRATTAEIVYKNVSYKGAPALVFYVGTDADLAENQKIKVFFWNSEVKNGVYNEHNADYVKDAEASVTIDGESYSAVISNETAPSELRRAVYAKAALVETVNGEEKVVYLGELLRYSVYDYALDMLSAADGAAQDQTQIYTALLDYAAAIQKILFTNQYNGAVNEQKLAEAGGWANEYYVVQFNRYIYNEETGLYEDEGVDIRYAASSADQVLNVKEALYYTKGGVTYSFRGFRNLDNSFILNDGDLVKALSDKLAVTKTPLYSNERTMTAGKIGITEYNVLYGLYNGDYVTYDDKQSLSDLGNNYGTYMSQYNVGTNTNVTALKTIKVQDYYYNGNLIQYFYTSDGSISGNIKDYHYVAVHKETGALGTGAISSKASEYDFYDINGAAVTKEEIEVISSAHANIIDDPTGGDRGNSFAFIKHIYDVTDPGKTPYEHNINIHNIKAAGEHNDSFATQGYVLYAGSVTPNDAGTAGSNKISGGNGYIYNKAPAVLDSNDTYPVHIFETDIYFSSVHNGTGTQIYIRNGSNETITQLSLASPARESDEFYIFVESGFGKSSGQYDATGNSLSNLLAGSNGSKTTGGKLNQREWINLRVEYVAAGSKALMKLYINGELWSYIYDNISTNDTAMSSLSVFNLHASRETYIHFDNTYFATDGLYTVASSGDSGSSDTAYSKEFYTEGDEYFGKGEYAAEAATVEKGYKPANGLKTGVTIVDDTLADGSSNTALQMYKSQNAGYSASVAAADPGGNIYVFETDLKVIGSDNKSEWMMKFALQNKNIASPNDTQEILMVCIMFKGDYWTLSRLNSPFDSSLKFKLDEWHNLRMEYDPISENMKIWVNNIEILNQKYTKTIEDDSTFAGVNLNLRARPDGSVYTQILFDNLYCSTKYQDAQGIGANVDKADTNKYNDFVAPDEYTEVKTDGTNKYIETGRIEIEGAPAHNRGNEYIFETDIKWNGATGFENTEDTIAKVLELKLDSEAGNILTLNGMATAVANSDLLIKAGTNTLGAILNGYWMNLRVVYSVGEPQLIDDVLNYTATYTVYINNGVAYTTTIVSPDMNNLTFAKATLSISGEDYGITPSVGIDNTYIGSRYIDDYKNGKNFASSDQNKSGNTDGDLPVVGEAEKKTKISIGSYYLYETDFKWVDGAATINLVGVDGAFFTIYVIPDANDPGYAKLSLENDIEKAFASVYVNIWHNIQIVAENGVYTVKLSGNEKATLEAALGATFTKATVVAEVANGVVIDNTYVDIQNKNFSASGANKDKSYSSFIDADNKGLLEYDEVLAEADPSSAYTDAYISINKAQIVMGKNTAVSSNILTLLNGKANGTATHIFETDIKWAATRWGVESAIDGNGHAPFYTITLRGDDGAELVTIYAVGVYNVDTVSTKDQYLKLFTSIEDVIAGNSFAYVLADLWYNIRVEYSADGSYGIYLNNNAVYSGNGAETNSLSGVDVALGEDVYDSAIYIKNTYVASID